MSRHEGTHIKRGGQSGHGGPPGTMPVEKAKDFKGTLGRLLRYLKSNRVKIIAACILAAFSTVFTIVGPKILALATDEISSGVFEKISGGAGTDRSALYCGHLRHADWRIYIGKPIFNDTGLHYGAGGHGRNARSQEGYHGENQQASHRLL